MPSKTASGGDAFLSALEKKLREQLRGEDIGFLLGAGASALDGQGYPMAADLWDKIKDQVPSPFREEIQVKLDTDGVWGIENALDLLDTGGPDDCPHRHQVTEAIASLFTKVVPPLGAHVAFLTALARRQKTFYFPIFCLNYDPLLERAAESARIRLVDGFHGHEKAFFDGNMFRQRICIDQAPVKRGTVPVSINPGVVYLIKLHGSMGWFSFNGNDVRRIPIAEKCPTDARRLMIPPQHRKVQDTTAPPYSSLWSFYHRRLVHGSLLSRLACIGYGMRDEHVNVPIENALANNNFTLLILARGLSDDVFNRWASFENVIIVTNEKSSLRGKIGPGHPKLWDFKHIAQEII